MKRQEGIWLKTKLFTSSIRGMIDPEDCSQIGDLHGARGLSGWMACL